MQLTEQLQPLRALVAARGNEVVGALQQWGIGRSRGTALTLRYLAAVIEKSLSRPDTAEGGVDFTGAELDLLFVLAVEEQDQDLGRLASYDPKLYDEGEND